MGDYLHVGNAGFASAVRGIYADKTEMISFINHTLGTKGKLTCVSRPRRFSVSERFHPFLLLLTLQTSLWYSSTC